MKNLNEDYSQFWDDCIHDFRRWRVVHPSMGPKLYMLTRKFEKMRTEYHRLNQHHFQTNNPRYLQEVKTLVDEAEEIYKRLKKLEFLATLAK